MNKNKQSDLIYLQRIAERQVELANELVFFNVRQANDLTVNIKLRPAVRRGLVQMVGDIFELTKKLKDDTKLKIGFNTQFIKQFRNSGIS